MYAPAEKDKTDSRKQIDTALVAKLNNEAQDWTAVCPVCGKALTGTIAELKKHKHDK